MKLIAFLDEKLRINEESNFLLRLICKLEEYSKEKYYEKPTDFGTLTHPISLTKT
jgi:hypothetical protein